MTPTLLRVILEVGLSYHLRTIMIYEIAIFLIKDDEGIMGRKANEVEDLLFFVRFFTKPFGSVNWSTAFIAISLTFAVLDYLLVPEEIGGENAGYIFARLTDQIMSFYHLRFMIPALLFGIVGLAGALTCLIRDLIGD